MLQGIMDGFPVAPPGLEYLLQVNELSVIKTSKGIFQSCNAYDFFGIDGELVYKATEQQEECCGPEIDCRITNTQGYNVLNLLEPSECCTCDTKLRVSSSSGELFGYIMEQWTSFTLSIDILNPLGLVCLNVKGPGWGENFMSDLHYKVSLSTRAKRFFH
ncbi:phospholipid scramblase 2-like [Aquarana catesbeiana]|uniref:phospholipid scramblase 2-like n=1 Tax=Aquarana catesbeiana TaxID=8400 RepID=UPI003CCA09A0